jgi:hypothetical protein
MFRFEFDIDQYLVGSLPTGRQLSGPPPLTVDGPSMHVGRRSECEHAAASEVTSPALPHQDRAHQEPDEEDRPEHGDTDHP